MKRLQVMAGYTLLYASRRFFEMHSQTAMKIQHDCWPLPGCLLAAFGLC